MNYRNWIKFLSALLVVNIIALGAAIYGKSKFDTAWDEYKIQRTTFMTECEAQGLDWSACWENFNNNQSPSLKAAALERAYPFTSKNSNQFFGYAIASFGGLAGMILISVFIRAAHRFFKR